MTAGGMVAPEDDVGRDGGGGPEVRDGEDVFWEYRSAKINGFWERGRHVWFLGCEEGFFGVFVDCGVACCAGDEVEHGPSDDLFFFPGEVIVD